jgi:hypothetical protein
MRQKTFLALAGFLALFIFAPFASYAAGQLSPGTYYVDISSGDDLTGDGSSGNPWQTMDHTMDRVDDGAEGSYYIHIASGTYSVENGETDGTHIIAKDNIAIIGEPGTMPVMDGADATICTIGIEIAASNVTIRNIAVTGFADWGIKVSSGTGNLIEGCEIYDNGFTTLQEGAGGIWIEDCSPDIRKNKIYNNYAYGILIDADGDVVEAVSPHIDRNEIHANNIGIAVNGKGTGIAIPAITNNLIYDIGSTKEYIIQDCGIGVSALSEGTASPSIYHNTIDEGPFDGIYIYNLSGTTTPDIKYNIITNFVGYGINNVGGIPTIDYNDVWGNNINYYGYDPTGSHNISENPLYGSYELQSGSPCIDTIPTTDPPGDTVEIDFAGYARLDKGSGFDMGAYEFIPDIAHDFELPGGTGDPTDYRMFTVPVELHTGAALKNAMEDALGPYDKGIWRVFAWDAGSSSYIELDENAFANLTVYPGRGFWVISTSTDTITFSGKPAPDGGYLDIPLYPGWNMIALPWASTEIELDRIEVSDGGITSSITSGIFTQPFVWDYTGSGPNEGYEQLTSRAVLQPGKAYWIKVLGTAELTMLVPNEGGGYLNESSVKTTLKASAIAEDAELPPAPPGVSGGGTTITESTGCFIGTVSPME